MLPQQEPHSAGAPLCQNLLPLSCKQEGSPSCGMKVQRGGSKTLCPFEFLQLVFGSLGHKRPGTRLQCYVCRHLCMRRSHTGAWYKAVLYIQHPHNVFFISLATHPHPRSAHTRASDRRLVAFSYSRCLIQGLSHLPLRQGPTSCSWTKRGKKGIEEEGMELGTCRNIPRTGGEMCEGWSKRGCLSSGSNYSNVVFIYSCLFGSPCLQFSLRFKYNNSPGVMRCLAERLQHILMTAFGFQTGFLLFVQWVLHV